EMPSLRWTPWRSPSSPRWPSSSRRGSWRSFRLADQSTLLPPVAAPGRSASLDARFRPTFGPLGRRLQGASYSPAVRLIAAIGSWLVVAEAITLAGGAAAGVFAHAIMLLLPPALSLRLGPRSLARINTSLS